MIENLIHHPHMIAIELGEDGLIADLTQGAEGFIGQSRRAVLGRAPSDVLEFDFNLFEILSRDGETSLFDQRVTTFRRSAAAVDVHITRGTGMVCMWIYPSAQSGTRARIQDAQGAARMASSVASMLGHEIRNPLGSIKGAAQLLADTISDEDRPILGMIEEEATRIGRLVAEFEDMSGQTPPHIEAINIHALLQQVVRAAQAGYARDLRIEENYDPSLPDVACDADRMLRVLHNIMTNAAEAIEAHHGGENRGRITLTTRYRAGVRSTSRGLPVEVTITDNGGGIDETISKDAFKPFVTSKANGTGLGLPMVAQMIEEIGGLIEIDTDNKGTHMRVLLPIWET